MHKVTDEDQDFIMGAIWDSGKGLFKARYNIEHSYDFFDFLTKENAWIGEEGLLVVDDELKGAKSKVAFCTLFPYGENGINLIQFVQEYCFDELKVDEILYQELIFNIVSLRRGRYEHGKKLMELMKGENHEKEIIKTKTLQESDTVRAGADSNQPRQTKSKVSKSSRKKRARTS